MDSGCVAPAFKRPLCDCGSCLDWMRLETARAAYSYHEGSEGLYFDEALLDDFFAVVKRWREARRAYLAHVEFVYPVVLDVAA